MNDLTLPRTSHTADRGIAAPGEGKEDSGFGDHHVERLVVRLGVDRLQPGQFKTDANRQRTRRERSQRAIEVAAAVADAMAGGIEAIHRDQQGLRDQEITCRRRRDAMLVDDHRRVWRPGAKGQRPASSITTGSRAAKPGPTFADPALDQRPQVGLLPERPAETDAHSRELWKTGLQERTDLPRQWRIPGVRRQGQPTLDQRLAQRRRHAGRGSDSSRLSAIIAGVPGSHVVCSKRVSSIEFSLS
jgi:hypothetical protein